MNPTKISVGLSGGVDSSVAAYLLQKDYPLDAFFMKNWESNEGDVCQSEIDFLSASTVAEILNIELNAVNFSQHYWDDVFQICLDQLSAGLTPNPDILCNEKIKFAVFLNHALSQGADKIATGHYAQVIEDSKGYHLVQALDQHKDQTYFLYRLNQMQLSRVLFPLGKLHKSEVRRIATEAQLPTASRPDSTGICFIGEKHYARFISEFLLGHRGTIVTESGLAIGDHEGIAPFTIGQRKGLNIGGVKGFDQKPWYVIGKDKQNQSIIVTQDHAHPALNASIIMANQLHWIQGEPPSDKSKLSVKIRHGSQQTDCEIVSLVNDTLTVKTHKPLWAPCPGQSLVLYQENECLGGGYISDYEGAL